MSLKNMSLCHSVYLHVILSVFMSFCLYDVYSVCLYVILSPIKICHWRICLYVILSMWSILILSLHCLLVRKGLGDEDVLYRILTNILLIFFLFSFFLFNFVPIIKEIRTINRMILRTKHLLNWPTQFLLFKLTIVTVPRLFIFCPFVLMWRNRDSCQPASYSLFVGRRWYFLS